MKCFIVTPEMFDGHKISFDYIYQKLESKDALGDVNTQLLRRIALEITSGIRIKKDYYVEKNGVRIIAPGDIKNEAVVVSRLKMVQPSVLKEKDIILSGDLLITAAGRSGQIVFVTDEMEQCAITSDIIKIRFTNRNDSKKIFSFLKSNLGKVQLNSIKHGRANKIFVEDVGRLEVPVNIELLDWILNNNSVSQRADKLYNKSKNIFEKFIEYNEIDDVTEKVFKIEERVLNTDRWDPSYYAYYSTKLIKVINQDFKDIRWNKLGELVEIKKTTKPVIDDERYVKYFLLADIDADMSIIKRWREGKLGDLSNRMRNVVSEGEVITAKAGSATGGKGHISAVITNEHSGMVTSDAFYNLIPIGIDPYYLLFVLKQPVVIKQIDMIAKGTLYKLVQKDEFALIKIPRLNEEIEALISSQIKEMYSLFVGSNKAN